MGEIFKDRKHAAMYWLLFPLMVVLIPLIGWAVAIVFAPILLLASMGGAFKEKK